MIQIVTYYNFINVTDRACGVDPGVKDYPFIYFANPTSP
jgi:hypothetical protein